jgi:hypothetical protein
LATSNLPPDDHVVRHAGYNQLRRDENDTALGLDWTAFLLRPGETFLSVTWLEHFAGSAAERLTLAVAAIAKTRNVAPRSGFGVARVGAVHDTCGRFDRRLRIIHEPDDRNPAHSGIHRLPQDDRELLDALAAEAFAEFHAAASFAADA